jgi:hypothetical protein
MPRVHTHLAKGEPVLYICSLIREVGQTIPADGQYHMVRFPFGAESYDAWGMHDQDQPDGEHGALSNDRSGLIWPTVAGWGWLFAMAYWEAERYTEVRDRFVRDPLGTPDSTCTEDYAITPGGQYRAKQHGIFVSPDKPIGYMVRVGAPGDRRLTHAQFKLAIDPDIATP